MAMKPDMTPDMTPDLTPDLPDETTRTHRAALVISVASLLLSSAAFAFSLDGDFERDTEQRLACLELPGPNDCGVDGR